MSINQSLIAHLAASAVVQKMDPREGDFYSTAFNAVITQNGATYLADGSYYFTSGKANAELEYIAIAHDQYFDMGGLTTELDVKADSSSILVKALTLVIEQYLDAQPALIPCPPMHWLQSRKVELSHD